MNSDDSPVRGLFRGAVPSHMTADEYVLFLSAQLNNCRLALEADSAIFDAILDGRPDQARALLSDRNRDYYQRRHDLIQARECGEYRDGGLRWQAARPAPDAT